MPKELKVSLAFTANTNEAIAAIKNLQKELNNLATGKTINTSGVAQLTPEIQKAMVAAGQLQAKLESAVNLKTGKLDLGLFSESLKKDKMTLQDYAKQLNALGPAGRQAFTNLAQSIIQSEAPLIRCNQKLKEFGVTLANTARWQLSSSMLHGFMGAVQSAYGYAQDLNKSLNDIRIVTGKSIEDMDAFAEKANKAARALSSTTNEYAKASLIYFQQGDTEAQAMEKAAITTKMANVTGQNAQEVSNQLTAIWNNFNKDGDIAYEHFADVLTKLGAATASSTDEIAGGLEKFAAVAETIGLSYDYAAAALATITSNTRESEEVVGTALKTIFARIQGLNLGETLEDGVTLNKYSSALQKVGISIFESNGELKEMDNILDELGAKWDTISKAQQTALAQTVAGVRQYTQLIALMENWNSDGVNDTDSMEANLATARGSDGELQKQADIYADSWEAAQNRVQASAEELYTKILNDDFFIGFLNASEKAINGVGDLIDSFGGLHGVLLTIGALVTRIFHQELAAGLRTVGSQLSALKPRKTYNKEKQNAVDSIKYLKSNDSSNESKAYNQSLDHEMAMQQKFLDVSKNLTQEEQKQLQIQMDLVRQMDQKAIAAAKAADLAQEELKILQDQHRIRALMDAQSETRRQGIVQGYDNIMSNMAALSPNEQGVISDIVRQGQERIRSRHNLPGDANLSGYSNELALEFFRSYKNIIDQTSSDIDKTKLSDWFEQKFKEAIDGSFQAFNPGQTRKNVTTQQIVAKATGQTQARGAHISNLATELNKQTITDENKIQIYQQLKEAIENAKTSVNDLNKALDESGNPTVDLANDFNSVEKELEECQNDAEKLKGFIDRLAKDGNGIGEVINTAATNAGTVVFSSSEYGEDLLHQAEASRRETATRINSENQQKNVDKTIEGLNKSFDTKALTHWSTHISNATSMIMGLGAAVSSVQGAINTFNNPNATGWEKISSVLAIVTSILPVFATGLQIVGQAGATAGAGITAAMGPVGLAIGAVVAIIYVAIKAFSQYESEIDKANRELKEAVKTSEQYVEATREIKSALDSIQNGFSAYDTAVEKLNDCVRGTDEWHNALQNVNNTVIELLKTYPELLSQEGLFTRDSNGMLVIDEGKRKSIIENAENEVTRAENLELIGKATESQKRAEVDALILKNNRELNQYLIEGYQSSGDFLVKNIDKLANKTSEEYEDIIRNMLQSAGNDAAYEDMIDSFVKSKSLLDDYAQSVKKASIEMDNAFLAIGSNEFKEKYNAQELEIISAISQLKKEEIYDEIYAADEQRISGDPNDQEVEELWARYQKASGETNLYLAENAVQGEGKNRVYRYKTADGETDEYSIEHIANTIAEYEAIVNMGNAAEEASKVLAKLGEEGIGFVAALSKGTDSQSLQAYLSGFTEEELKKLFQNGTINYKILGIDENKFNELMSLYQIDPQEFVNNLKIAQESALGAFSDQDKLILGQFETENTSVADQERFLNNISSLGKKLQDSDLKGKASISNVILENNKLKPEILADYLGELNKINFSSEDAAESIELLNKKYNIGGEAIDTLVREVDSLPKTFETSTEAISQTLGEINKITKDLKFGDVISNDDLKILQDAGLDIDQYFTKMYDGTWKLIDKADEFQNIIKEYSINQLLEKKQNFQDSRDQIAKNYGVSSNVLTAESGYWSEDISKAKIAYLQSFEDISFTAQDAGKILNFDLDSEEKVTSDMMVVINQMMKQVNEIEYTIGSQIASTVESVSELNALMWAGKISAEDYNKLLESIFNQEVESYGLDIDEINEQAKALQKMATKVDNLSDEIEHNEQLAKEITKEMGRFGKAVDKVSSSYDDWLRILNSEDIGEQVDIINDLADAYGNLLDIDGDKLSENFLLESENLKLMQQAANGSAEAYNKLQIAAASDLYEKNIGTLSDTIRSGIEEIANIDSVEIGDKIEIGTDLDNKLQDMYMSAVAAARQGGKDTAAAMEEANALMQSIGFEPPEVEFEEKEVYVTGHLPTGAKPVPGGGFTINGIPLQGYSWSEEPGSAYTYKTTMLIPKGSGRFTKTSETLGSKSSSSKKGGGGGGKIKPTKKSDIVERYKEVNDSLDDVSRSAEKATNSISRLYGKDQEKAINDLIEAEQKQVSLLNSKRSEAVDYLVKDQSALNAAASAVNVKFVYDKDGNIDNYTKQMEGLYSKIKTLEDQAAKNPSKAKELETLKEKVETLKDAISQYDETKELIQDIDKEIDDLRGKPPLPYITSELIDILKEANDELDDIEDKIDKINKESERFTGQEQINRLKQSVKLEKDRLKTLKDQAQINSTDIAEKRSATDELAGRLGLTFTYDSMGNITNYTEELGKLEDTYQSMQDKAAKDGLITPAEQAGLDAYKENIEQLKSYIEKYSDAVENQEENLKAQTEAFYAFQDKRAEALNLTLELNLELNENDLRKVEYELSKIEDDFYSMAEAAAYMFNNNSSLSKYSVYKENLSELNDQQKRLNEEYVAGKISQTDYAEGLKTVRDGMYENLENIQELDKTMMNYYGNTLDAAGEEIAKYTDQMEHQVSVLDHYKNVMDIMGQSNDFGKMGKILEGQSKVMKNQAKVAKETFEMYSKEASDKFAKYQEALASKDQAAADLYKKEYEAALVAANEAEEEYLSKAEAYAQSLRAIFENELSGLAQSLENALTGGTSFDQINDALSRAASIQEEYLTTTNQIYETNKLMRTAQQAIDKTTNSIAKNRLKQFINETQQLQNQNKLSKYELEIQQAKYNLHLAEIALEEAQNAKSMVRLQRDSEGNFGYVYTADAAKTAEAEQKLEDAQNRLYNIALNGANSYTEKYQQTLSEMYSTLTDLQQQYLDGAFESEEEYHKAVTAAKEYYYEKLEQYSSLHAIALETDSRVIADAWSSQFSTMIYSTETWKNHVEEYVDDAAQAFVDWKNDMANIEEELNLNDIEEAVDDIVDANEKLTEVILKKDGVLDSVKKEITEVSNLTSAWVTQRAAVKDIVSEYENYINTLNNVLKKLQEVKNTDENSEENSKTSNNDPSDNSKTKSKTKNSNNNNNNNSKKDQSNDKNDSKKKSYDDLTKQGVALAIWEGSKYGWGHGSERKKRLAEKGFDPEEIQELVNNTDPNVNREKKYGISDLSKYSYSSFDTGGYTGSWGKDGKMAILHEKELILNKEDTKNMLEAIKVLRNLYVESDSKMDPSLLISLLGSSQEEMIDLYERELSDLDKEMNAMAMSNAAKSQLSILTNKASSDLDIIQNISDDLNNIRNSKITELSNELITNFIDQMIDLNEQMIERLDRLQENHSRIISSYESSLSNMIKQFDGSGGAYGKINSIYEKMIQVTEEKFLSSDLNKIIEVIDLYSLSNRIGSGGMRTPNIGNDMVTDLQQHVEISASFPNVSDHNELEEAFNNLINQASQYANKK